MYLADKPLDRIPSDLDRIARDYAPCDVVADIEAGTRYEHMKAFVEFCHELPRVC